MRQPGPNLGNGKESQGKEGREDWDKDAESGKYLKEMRGAEKAGQRSEVD